MYCQIFGEGDIELFVIIAFCGVMHSNRPFHQAAKTDKLRRHKRSSYCGNWVKKNGKSVICDLQTYKFCNYGIIVSATRRRGDIKGAVSCLRQFLAIEITLKIMKNAFYFTSKAFFVLKIFRISSWLFVHVTKKFDQKDFKFNLKFYDVTAWLARNCNTHNAQYLEK